LRDEVDAFRRSAAFYSLLAILAPYAVLVLGLWLLDTLIDRDSVILLSGLDVAARFKGSIDGVVSALNDFDGRLRFAGPQIMLAVAAWVAIFGAPWIVYRTLRAHGGIEAPMFFLLLLTLVLLGLAIGFVAVGVNGVHVRDFFAYVVPEMLRRLGYARSTDVVAQMEAHGRYGVIVGIAAATAVIAAMGVIAYRWRESQSWDQPEVLRSQMNALLFLFCIASALLVFANSAIRAWVEWPADIPADGAGSLVNPLRATTLALSYFSGAFSSAVLLATSIPAFASLLLDIDLAGRLHGAPVAEAEPHEVPVSPPGTKWSNRAARAEAEPAPILPSRPSRLATYKEVQAWKADHGLSFSAGGVSTALIAAAAPLLTSPVIDLTKALALPF
jgi:hypothetical protein